MRDERGKLKLGAKPRGAAQIEHVQEQARALELRAKGMSYRAIGKELRISHETAHEWVEQAIRTVLVEPVAEVVTLEIDRLDSLFASAWSAVMEDKDLSQIPNVLRVMERRAKLLGLDAEVKTSTKISGDLAVQNMSMGDLLRDVRTMLAEIDGEDPEGGGDGGPG